MGTYQWALLLVVFASVQGKCHKDNGLCPQSIPQETSGCPFEGKECIKEAKIGLLDWPIDGSFLATCLDETKFHHEIWFQGENDVRFYYAHLIDCADKNYEGDELNKTVKWRATTWDQDHNEVAVAHDVKRYVCAVPTGCPLCVSLLVDVSDECHEDKNCIAFPQYKTIQGIKGHEDSTCVVQQKARIELEDGTSQIVDSVQCNSTTHQWFGIKGNATYPRKPGTTTRVFEN